MLKQRIITAVLLLPLVGILLFVLSLHEFAAALVIVLYLMAWEWGRLGDLRSGMARSFYAMLVALSALGVWYLAPALEFWPSTWFIEWHLTSTLVVYWLSFVAWACAFLMMLLSAKHRSFWASHHWPRLLLGWIILLGFWVSVIAIQGSSTIVEPYRGAYLVLFMLFMIWGADVGGYLFGKLWGKRKLAPAISPGKTWEGALGGVFLSSVVATVGIFVLDLPTAHPLAVVAAVLLLVVVSVLGDLFESLLKRQVQIKDSSQLLPGHGGLLDRLDSTIAVAPFYVLVAKLLGWI
ncbi:phosphatidate cytidylyltransferase [Pleionea litopenaei]|uniref:Phosphatidate cytidylyltransferase n=1 Tax=Pleionea litopenaei TaxID=3070815 RepID=A0AA51X6B8_9GAMM|nr:phosphatidate cytidylyltransferase [Pleionea sp. HL-JVS1]WMS86963.1 phosphatidate cytidylyltransferase [Pleionea sp. HL-JVS1]